MPSSHENDFLVDISISSVVSGNKQFIDIASDIVEVVEMAYIRKCSEISKDMVEALERGLMLQQLDIHWREHLASLDALRQGIHLRGYAQKNPKQEYKREAFELLDNCSIRSKMK